MSNVSSRHINTKHLLEYNTQKMAKQAVSFWQCLLLGGNLRQCRVSRSLEYAHFSCMHVSVFRQNHHKTGWQNAIFTNIGSSLYCT